MLILRDAEGSGHDILRAGTDACKDLGKPHSHESVLKPEPPEYNATVYC